MTLMRVAGTPISALEIPSGFRSCLKNAKMLNWQIFSNYLRCVENF